MKRFLTVFLAFAMLMAICLPSLADGLFNVPLEVTINGIHAEKVDPLDDQRLGELNQLLGHIGVTLRTGQENDTVWSGISISVDGNTVDEVWLGERAEDVLICLPGNETAYSAFGLSALDTVLGTEPVRVSEMMLPDLFLSDAEAFVDAFFAERDGVEVTKESQTVRDTNEVTYGRVTSRHRVVADDSSAVKEAMLASCPEGALKRFLSDLTITEIKDCYALCKKDGKAAKVVFNGMVTDQRSMAYQMTLEWKIRRGEKNAADRDHMTLTYKGEAAVGSLEFRLTRKSAGEVTYDIYNWEQNGFTMTKGKKDTIHVKRDGSDLVTGEISIHLSGSDKTVLNLNFDVQIGEGVSGNIEWKLEGASTFSGTAVLHKTETKALGQPLDLKAVPLPDGRAEREAIAQAFSDHIASKLIAHLVLLENQEDTIYLRKDMTEEAWNEIITAARELLGMTGGEE